MIEVIKSLEKSSRTLEADHATRKLWFEKVAEYGIGFVDNLYEQKAYQPELNSKSDPLFYPDGKKHSLDELIKVIREEIDPPGINAAHGGHMGYIPGGGIFPASIGDFIAAVGNKYAGIYYGAPGAVKLENELLRWLCDLMGFPSEAVGNLTSGGSIATLIAVTAARDAKNITAQKISQSVIYLSEQSHHSCQKAIRIAGLREAKIHYCKMDKNFRIDPISFKEQVVKDLKNSLIPFLLISSVGTTDVGAVDPVETLDNTAKEFNLWHHVDAAYGGFFILVDQLKHFFSGIDQVDSITIDPHKGLFLPYGSGAVLFKNPDALLNSHYYEAPYMKDALSVQQRLSPANLSPELTKHFRGLRMWLPLMLHGLEAFKSALEEKVMLCRYFYEKVQGFGFEVGPFPDLSVCTYRFVPEKGSANEFNLALLELIKKDGRIFVSSTILENIVWIRLAVLNFRTHLDLVDTYLEILFTAFKKLQKAWPTY